MRPDLRSPLHLLLAIVATVAGVLALTVGLAAPAGAHAVVVASTPADGERLSTAPAEVTITFSEAVTSDLGGITVLSSPAGDRVDNDDTTQPTATTVRASLKPDLPDGTYAVTYKVVSADGHPISGAIKFGVGSGQLGDISALGATGDPATERLGAVARWLTYTAGLLAAGLTLFLVFVHDGASDRRRLVHVVQVATVVGAFGALLTIAVQASLATGEGLGAATQVDVLRGVLREGLGWSSAVLLVGLALCHAAATARPSTLAQGLAFYGGLAVTTSFVFWGHALEAPNRWLAIGADVVHVAVAAAWFGGLVGLTSTLRARTRAARRAGLPEPTLLGAPGPSPATAASPSSLSAAVLDPPPERTTADDGPGSLAATVAIVRRFSALAAVSVVVVAISGIALGWQELGSLGALTSSSYGQTLLVKLALVGAVLVLAGYNRFLLLPWLLADETDDAGAPDPTTSTTASAASATRTTAQDASQEAEGAASATAPTAVDPDARAEIDRGVEAGWRTLLRTVAAEALILVAVLAVTAVLVNVVPGRTDATASGPFGETKPFRTGQVSLTITPNQAGINNFHVDFLDPSGRPTDLAQKVTLELRLPEKDLGPFEREMVKAGTGHFILEGVSDMSITGTWQITLTVRVSDFDQERITFTDPIG